MPYYQSTYHSRVYRDFKAIDSAAYRQIIHFYEKQEASIQGLDFEERFDMLSAYVDALFEIGSYQKHLLLVDYVIESAILQNIQSYKGKDIYFNMLFRKAASLYNLVEYDSAVRILRELVKIDPWNKDAVSFLKKCMRKKQPRLLQYSKAASILLFLLAAFVIGIEVLFIHPFYNQLVPLVERSWMLTLLFGIILLVIGDLVHRLHVERQVHQFTTKIKHQKERCR